MLFVKGTIAIAQKVNEKLDDFFEINYEGREIIEIDGAKNIEDLNLVDVLDTLKKFSSSEHVLDGEIRCIDEEGETTRFLYVYDKWIVENARLVFNETTLELVADEFDKVVIGNTSEEVTQYAEEVLGAHLVRDALDLQCVAEELQSEL